MGFEEMERMRSMLWIIGGALALVVCLSLTLGTGSAEANSWYPRSTDKWTKGFRLETDVTYTYVLRKGDRNRPTSRLEEKGRLNLWIPPGQKEEIRFWYSIDGVHKSGVAPNDPHGLVGALVLSALVGTDPLSLESLRLLTTPFQWVQWADQFLESSFRHGVIWEVYQHPALRFSADRRGNETYEGEVTLGRDTLLELRIKLSDPLPERIVSRYGRDVYQAELESTPPRRILR